MKGDLVTKILLVIVSLLLVFNLIKSKGSENVVWGEPNRTVVAGAAISSLNKGVSGSPLILRFWSDGTVDGAYLYSRTTRLADPWETLEYIYPERKSRRRLSPILNRKK